MSQQVIKCTEKLSEAIRARRLELGLTIEDAATKAGIGTKTWCRYETGGSIRRDKARGVCKALNWMTLPRDGQEDMVLFDINEYRRHSAWSETICNCFGEAAAVSFVMGSDILLDYIAEDIEELSRLPRGSHLGQLDTSMLKCLLPEQFMTRYDYEFLYLLKTEILRTIQIAHKNSTLVAHSVMQELALYLIVDASEFLMETTLDEMEEEEISGTDYWKDWIYDVFDDMDIVTWLYSDLYVTEDDIYHFNHWQEEQFFCGK